jgi:hypothetical protein
LRVAGGLAVATALMLAVTTGPANAASSTPSGTPTVQAAQPWAGTLSPLAAAEALTKVVTTRLAIFAASHPQYSFLTFTDPVRMQTVVVTNAPVSLLNPVLAQSTAGGVVRFVPATLHVTNPAGCAGSGATQICGHPVLAHDGTEIARIGGHTIAFSPMVVAADPAMTVAGGSRLLSSQTVNELVSGHQIVVGGGYLAAHA